VGHHSRLSVPDGSEDSNPESMPLLNLPLSSPTDSYCASSPKITNVTLPTYTSSTGGDDLSKASTDSLLSLEAETHQPIKEPAPPKKKKTIWERVDKAAFLFALRIAVLIWISALFVLIRSENWNFPGGMWVLVTVLFVSWFPQLDAASVIEKIVQRLLGTFIGAVVGLLCGFASLIFTDHPFTQSIFLGICVFIFNFLIVFIAGQCKVGGVKVINRFAYATILCVLTFCICVLPFSQKEDPKWALGVIRVFDVVVGCGIGALGSIFIAPKSTTDVLYEKASRQVVLAGEAAEAVMKMSSDFFAGRIEVRRLADELLNGPLERDMRWKLSSASSYTSQTVENGATDVALKKYEDAISDWRLSKMLFPLVKYDPFKIKLVPSDGMSDALHTEIARTLARCLRIQTTIVVIDGMVRSDADYDFSLGQLESFAGIGKLIRDMLTLPLDRDRSNTAANILFVKLEEKRRAIYRMSHAVSRIEESSNVDRCEGLKDFQKMLLSKDSTFFETLRSDGGNEFGRGIPLNATGRDDNTLFFLQLVEHLILRSLRLYQAWTHVETIRKREMRR